MELYRRVRDSFLSKDVATFIFGHSAINRKTKKRVMVLCYRLKKKTAKKYLYSKIPYPGTVNGKEDIVCSNNSDVGIITCKGSDYADRVIQGNGLNIFTVFSKVDLSGRRSTSADGGEMALYEIIRGLIMEKDTDTVREMGTEGLRRFAKEEKEVGRPYEQRTDPDEEIIVIVKRKK